MQQLPLADVALTKWMLARRVMDTLVDAQALVHGQTLADSMFHGWSRALFFQEADPNSVNRPDVRPDLKGRFIEPGMIEAVVDVRCDPSLLEAMQTQFNQCELLFLGEEALSTDADLSSVDTSYLYRIVHDTQIVSLYLNVVQAQAQDQPLYTWLPMPVFSTEAITLDKQGIGAPLAPITTKFTLSTSAFISVKMPATFL